MQEATPYNTVQQKESRIETSFLRHCQPCFQFATATTLKFIYVFQRDGLTFRASNDILRRGMLRNPGRIGFRATLHRPDGACFEWPCVDKFTCPAQSSCSVLCRASPSFAATRLRGRIGIVIVGAALLPPLLAELLVTNDARTLPCGGCNMSKSGAHGGFFNAQARV